MLAADIILVCSRNEAFGRVVVDGMKLGRPVVYPRSGGIPEYMKDGVTGLSYSPGDVSELVQRIEDLIDDPERAARIGAEAKRYACAKFTRNGTDVRILRDLQRTDGRTDWRVAMPKRVVASLASVAIQQSKTSRTLNINCGLPEVSFRPARQIAEDAFEAREGQRQIGGDKKFTQLCARTGHLLGLKTANTAI